MTWLHTATDSRLSKLKPLKNLWYEDEAGNRWYPTDEELKDAYGLQDVQAKDFKYQHLLIPELVESICDNEGEVLKFSTTMNTIGPIVVALVQDYGWNFADAITVAAHTCERCLNLLLEEATGEKCEHDITDVTWCDLCQFVDPEHDERRRAEDPKLGAGKTRGEMTRELGRKKAMLILAMRRKAGDSQAALIAEVLGEITEDEIAHSGLAKSAHDFIWERTQIDPRRTNWGQDSLESIRVWLDQEEADYFTDMGEDRVRGGDTEKRRVLQSEPIVVLLRPDGVYEVLDGNHRVTQALIWGVPQLPALVGKPRMK